MANRNQADVPGAEGALDEFKFEIANEVGVDLKHGYNGDLTSREAGKIGGAMVKRMVQFAEENLKNGRF